MEFQQLLVNDRYLYDHHRIVNRLGAYIRLAYEMGELGKVKVKTWDADHRNIRQSTREVQNQAIQQLQSKFPEVEIAPYGRHTVS